MILLAATRIWDRAPHNAFTDLIRFRDRWLCAFREGDHHHSPDGALRIIASPNSRDWEALALVREESRDLRDPKLTLRPDGQLMLSAAGLQGEFPYRIQSLAWFSADGAHWSPGHPIGDPDFWLWRITWHRGQAYALAYNIKDEKCLRLYRSADGFHFESLVPRLFDQGYANESALVFRDDIAYCLLRRDGDPHSALLGRAAAPYTTWEWRDLGRRVGGPQMIFLPDGRLVAAVRLYDGKVRTALCSLNPASGELAEILPLPSGGDTSYPGLAWHEGELWSSYYSSHEGKTAIYLARVAPEALP